MRFSALGVVAAFAAVDAFLLPPEISAADSEIIKTLPFEDAVGIDSRIMEIDCPGCPVMTDIEGKMYSAQVESVLQLEFSLAHENDRDQLLLNGLQIYPMDPRASTFMKPLTASQMVRKPDNTWFVAATPELGYSLAIRHPVAMSNNDQLNLIAIHVEIVEVADKFLGGIPGVEIKVLETPTGKLMIGSTEIASSTSTESTPETKGKDCTTLLCQWGAFVADKFSKFKGCGSKARPTVHGSGSANKHHGHHGRPHAHDGPNGYTGHHPHDGPHRSFRHHRHGGFSRFLRGIVLHVFIPVLIGIMVGITASLVGMIVGHIAIFVWRLLFRRNQKYTKIQQEEVYIVEDCNEEVKSVQQQQEGPPPVYEEVVIVDEKASE